MSPPVLFKKFFGEFYLSFNFLVEFNCLSNFITWSVFPIEYKKFKTLAIHCFLIPKQFLYFKSYVPMVPGGDEKLLHILCSVASERLSISYIPV